MPILPIKYFTLIFSNCSLLSQIGTDGERASLVHKGISAKRFLSHSASELAFSKVINSASIVDRVMQVCWADFQEIALPPRMKTFQLVDFISFESKIQFASLNHSRTLGSPLKHKP